MELFDLWRTYHNIPAWFNVCRTLGVDEATIRDLEDLDQNLIELQRFEHADRAEVNRKIRELIEEAPQGWRRERRRAFLALEIERLTEELDGLLRAYEQSFKADDYYGNRALLSCLIEKREATKAKHEREHKALSNDRAGQDHDDLTEKIEIAKQRDFTDFIELDRHRKAQCPFHNDKTPSFSIKDNRGKCFGCGWSGDLIDFIQQRDGLNFPETVRLLAG